MSATHTTSSTQADPLPEIQVAAALIAGSTPEQIESIRNDVDKRDALVRQVAYSSFERRGCVAGHDLDDWLAAEIEVERRLAELEASTTS